MSEQDSRRTATKRHRNRQTDKQDGTQAPALQQPANDDKEAWKSYWKAQGRPWQTEPEIDQERQIYLAGRRAIVPDIENGIYPFREIKLSRADIEWLLTTHENGKGPVDWSNGGLKEHQGLDLRGADLRGVNLSGLPLTALHGALDWEEWLSATIEQRESALTCLEGANLSFAHLERAVLRGAHMEKAVLFGAHLEGAYLYTTHLDGSTLKRACFDSSTQLGKSILASKKFGAASLADVRWNGVNLTEVNWESVKELGEEQIARLQKRRNRTSRDKQKLFNEYRRAVRANRQLTIVLQEQGLNEEAANFAYRAQALQRQLALLYILHQQMNLFQRVRKVLSYLFSLFLDLLAGYGYKPGRSLIWYLVIVFGFAIAYYAFGHLPLLPDALVFSLTSFHLSKVHSKNELATRSGYIFDVGNGPVQTSVRPNFFR